MEIWWPFGGRIYLYELLESASLPSTKRSPFGSLRACVRGTAMEVLDSSVRRTQPSFSAAYRENFSLQVPSQATIFFVLSQSFSEEKSPGATNTEVQRTLGG